MTSTCDMRAFYNMKFGKNNAQVYVNISNLFNHLNQVSVYNDSGLAGYTNYEIDALNQNTGEYVNSVSDWFNNETYYSNPRRIEVGVRYDF